MNEERKRILQMLADGQINAAEAEALLDALDGDGRDSATQLTKPKGSPRLLRIRVSDNEGSKVRLNLPVALARFAFKFIPEEQRRQIAEAGFDLDELLASLSSEVPEGKLVEVEGPAGENVLIEVV